jgi:alpha-L-fucosidase
MKKIINGLMMTAVLLLATHCRNKPAAQHDYLNETREAYEARMQWWADARFGLFIHWGLYSILAGEWQGETGYGEWIRQSAKIPLEEYDKLLDRFNPVKFDAERWVRMAKDAGMKYIVITSKHHDGFCLFDSKYTDFDVMSTPFKRDILGELAKACEKEGIRLCFYHSIMDWHHPDYLPRRDWETNRSAEGADLNRYITHLKEQLGELTSHYGKLGVLWFDGEWESTWTHEYGVDLYNHVRNLQPDIIINNRVDVGREGMAGLTREGGFAGDFGTPEQEIPPTGLPGTYWETCMTMNDHWGYNKNDHNWKSSTDLIRKLADIASKGGNFLLNVGPMPDGTIPPQSIIRLAAMGQWMKVNSEAIYGTQASPFKSLPWGRCTQKSLGENTRLYLHVFDWPVDGKLVVPGIFNTPIEARLLPGEGGKALIVTRDEDALIITVPMQVPDTVNTVVVLDVRGKPDISEPPAITAGFPIFIDTLHVNISSGREKLEMRYTVDGTVPSMKSPLVKNPLVLSATATVSARSFRNGKPVSETSRARFEKVFPSSPTRVKESGPGIQYYYYEGDWDSLPDFNTLKAVASGIAIDIDLSQKINDEHYGFLYTGYIKVPLDGVYVFYTDSDDGSRLYVDGKLVVDNNGLHGMQEAEGVTALGAGLHPFRVMFFEKTGGDDLKVLYRTRGMQKQPVAAGMLRY